MTKERKENELDFYPDDLKEDIPNEDDIRSMAETSIKHRRKPMLT